MGDMMDDSAPGVGEPSANSPHVADITSQHNTFGFNVSHEQAAFSNILDNGDGENKEKTTADMKNTLDQLLPALQQKLLTSSVNPAEIESLLKRFDPAMINPLMEILQYMQQKSSRKTTTDKHTLSSLGIGLSGKQLENKSFSVGMSHEHNSASVGSSQKELSSPVRNQQRSNTPDSASQDLSLSQFLQEQALTARDPTWCIDNEKRQRNQPTWESKLFEAGLNNPLTTDGAKSYSKEYGDRAEKDAEDEIDSDIGATGGMMDSHDLSQRLIKQEPDGDLDSPPPTVTGDRQMMVTISGRNRGLGKANEPKYVCQICGDVAAGFHCGAYVCEACKKFYLRCLKSGGSVAYTCPKNQDCPISRETRSHCQFCRYQKCVRLGMYKPGRDDSRHLRVDFKSIPCKVCAAPSSGFHFGAITCEGCKGFFRRMVKEKLHKKFVCMSGGGCDVASSNRTSCKACRYYKCLSIGMALKGTRLGRQSNSVKRSTLIEYQKQHGMDVALFPKLGEESTDIATAKVEQLLQTKAPELQIKAEHRDAEIYGVLPTSRRNSLSEDLLRGSEQFAGVSTHSSGDFQTNGLGSGGVSRSPNNAPVDQSNTAASAAYLMAGSALAFSSSPNLSTHTSSVGPATSEGLSSLSPVKLNSSNANAPSGHSRIVHNQSYDNPLDMSLDTNESASDIHTQNWLNFLSGINEQQQQQQKLHKGQGRQFEPLFTSSTGGSNATDVLSHALSKLPPDYLPGLSRPATVTSARSEFSHASPRKPVPTWTNSTADRNLSGDSSAFTSLPSAIPPQSKASIVSSGQGTDTVGGPGFNTTYEAQGQSGKDLRLRPGMDYMPQLEPLQPLVLERSGSQDPATLQTQTPSAMSLLSPRSYSTSRRGSVEKAPGMCSPVGSMQSPSGNDTHGRQGFKRAGAPGAGRAITDSHLDPHSRAILGASLWRHKDQFVVEYKKSRMHVDYNFPNMACYDPSAKNKEDDKAKESGSSDSLSNESKERRTSYESTPDRQPPSTPELISANPGSGEPTHGASHAGGGPFCWDMLNNQVFMTTSVLDAYRELENLGRPRASLHQEQTCRTDKARAWYAAYESFMHHAKYTLRFVKKIPGFKQLPMEDQVTLVREAVYPITLIFHSQYDETMDEIPRWFCNTNEERDKIWHFFPKFRELIQHIRYSGQLFHHLQVKREEYAFLCAIIVFTAENFMVKDVENIRSILEGLSFAMIHHMQTKSVEPNRAGILLLRLTELKRANYEHTQIAMEVQRENPDIDFSPLWVEMFLSKV